VSRARALRKPLLFCAVLLPWRLRSLLLRHALGWRLHPTSRVGLSLIDATNVRLGPGTRIGHFNVIRGLTHLEMGEAAAIGNWNWFSAAPMFEWRDRGLPGEHFRGLRIGTHTAITSRHYLDCSGGVTIGAFTTLGGVRTTILSHEIDVAAGVQTTQPVSVGDYCFISSNVCLTPGSHIPSRSLVAMGAVVVGRLPQEGALYGGVPAGMLRSDIGSGAYFNRRKGFVGLAPDDAPRADVT
jgi:acetyltransferase-like isoleucine patch superfamily enzyme